MKAELERRQRAREKERMEADFSVFVRASWPVLEPTEPLVWGWPLAVVCQHAQALVEDWMRATLARIGTLPPQPTGPLPTDAKAREEEERRRHHVAGLWREARRLGVLEDGGRVRVVPQRFRKLLVNIPPGYAKSRILSVMFLAWVWLRWPSFTALCLSSNPDVARRDAERCRELVKSSWYRDTFDVWWNFSETEDAKGHYRTSAGGWRLSKGWKAVVTGDRADAEILDDPNDAEGVWSEAEREGVNNRWDDALESRVNDPERSIRLGVQQRVHTQDWSHHVLKEEGDWEHLKIKQEADGKNACDCATCTRGHTALGWRDERGPGVLALPERFGPGYVTAQKRKSMRWAAQHQQEPMVAEGNLFKASWWRFWRWPWEDEVPELAARTVVLEPDAPFDLEESSWDCAFKKTEGSSKVAGGAWAKRGPHKYLMDLVWEPLSFTETCAALEAQALRRPRVGAKVVEDKANGPAVIDTLASKVPGLVPFPVSEYGSKEARAAATAWHVEGGNVFMPLHAPWRDRYIAAHASAPKGEGMDAVDQQSQILLRWQSGTSEALYSDSLASLVGLG
ncbi:hypothetical protein D7Y27_36520 [Corallococcus sp. AB004]|nr:hypothetical protein D7Y27_36520 [Corallococcus sp. AB004]